MGTCLTHQLGTNIVPVFLYKGPPGPPRHLSRWEGHPPYLRPRAQIPHTIPRSRLHCDNRCPTKSKDLHCAPDTH